ncbi:MAG: phage tail sheath family protein [Nitrosomonadales bacterium]|nr:phage tail sheath family protein [Nitrosomonadales bacterium]
MAGYKAPGVYVEEISIFPPPVAEVETAVPAFIGYTQTSPGSLRNRPLKIISLLEYEAQFGKARNESITVTLSEAAVNGVYPILSLTEPVLAHYLYYSIRMFFENGGGKCYVVSVGDTASAVALGDGASGLLAGLNAAAREDDPTLIVIPDAVLLDNGAAGTEYATLMRAALAQCATSGDRFAILDVTRAKLAYSTSEISDYRKLLGASNLKYGAAYYPFIKTSLNYVYADSSVTLSQPDEAADADSASGRLNGLALANLNDPAHAGFDPVNYRNIRNQLSRLTVTLPPSGAIAGIYAATDASRGVWKAPANVSLNAVTGPSVNTDSSQQNELNADTNTGKSINAIRSFPGKDTLVRGARTLAGNDNEWRYIPVRRFFNMVEESLKKSTYWAVFEPNDANTWNKVRGMIENYLTQKWREGALAGATAKEAFFVRCGLGATMTAQDILEGRMNVEIGMAAVRPAEFIILKFSHKLQAS